MLYGERVAHFYFWRDSQMYNQSVIEALVSRALSEGGMAVNTVFHSAQMKTTTSFFAGGAWELGRTSVSYDQLSMVLVNSADGNAVMLWTESGLAEVWTSLLLKRASCLPGSQQKIHLNLSQTMLWLESGVYQPHTVVTGLRNKRQHRPQRNRLTQMKG